MADAGVLRACEMKKGVVEFHDKSIPYRFLWHIRYFSSLFFSFLIFLLFSIFYPILISFDCFLNLTFLFSFHLVGTNSSRYFATCPRRPSPISLSML